MGMSEEMETYMTENSKINLKGNDNSYVGGDVNNYFIGAEHRKLIYLYEELPAADSENVLRQNVLVDIKQALSNSDMILVHGISGIGKTEIVKQVAIQESGKKYWITCEDDAAEEEIEIVFDSIAKVDGEKISILDKIRKERCLVVLDNYELSLKELCRQFNENNKHNSKLIITRKNDAKVEKLESVNIDFMEDEQALKIFDPSTNAEFDNNDFMELFHKIEKHPMMLRILKNYLLDEDSGIELSDIQHKIHRLVELKDEDITSCKTICSKIIGWYYEQNKKVVDFLSLFETNIIESGFLKSILFADVRELVKRNFLLKEQDHYYMHSIVKDSIKVIKTQIEISEEYEKSIEEYLKQEIEARDISFYNFCAYNIDVLEKLEKEKSENISLLILIYNVYIVLEKYRYSNVLMKKVEQVLERNRTDEYYYVKLLIEYLEVKSKNMESEEKKRYIEENIAKLSEIRDEEQDTSIKELINHHIGKFYNWINEFEKCIEIMEKIVAKDNQAYGSLLQLCRAYRAIILNKNDQKNEKEKKDEKDRYINKVITLLENTSFDNMPVSIFMEIVSLMVNQPFNIDEILDICIDKNYELLKEYSELYSKDKKYEHVYLSMGKIGEKIYYPQGDFYKKWFKSVEHPKYNLCSKEMLMAMIKIYSFEIMRRSYFHESIGEVLDLLREYWSFYKNTFFQEDNDNDVYSVNYIVKCLLKIYETDEAEKELDKVYNDENKWHLKFKAEILKRRGNLEAAFIKIDKAYKLCSDEEYAPYIGAIKNDRKKIMKLLNK